LLINTLVGTGGVVIIDVCYHNPLQVSCVEDENKIEALLADRADPTFRDGVGLHRQLHPY
jgi:hypothetical protein